MLYSVELAQENGKFLAFIADNCGSSVYKISADTKEECANKIAEYFNDEMISSR